MLSASRFYADPDANWGYEPSFDGSLVAWWGTKGARPAVFVGEVGSAAPKVIASFSGPVTHFSWRGYANRLLLTEANRLFELDPRRPSERVDVTPQGFQTWQIISEPTVAGGKQAIISHDRSPVFTDLYETLDNGSARRLLEENAGQTESWLLDGTHRPCLRVERGEGGLRRYVARITDENGKEAWRVVAELGTHEILVIWGVDPDGHSYHALSNRGRDKVAFVSLDPKTGAEAVIAGSDDVDISDAIIFNAGQPTDLAIIRDGFPARVPVTERGRIFSELLTDTGKHVDFSISGASKDGRIVIASVSIDAQQPRPVLFDLAEKRSIMLGQAPQVLPRTKTTPITIAARDGEKLSAILTLPENADTRLPAVVVCHDGPARHDNWGFNRDRTFLASRGYAVLSVNYRGSTGFGKRFQALGFRQFGRAIQDDIVDAAQWLIDSGTAEPGRIAIQGESFGGMIAALAMCRDPGLFAAAVIDCAVLDLPFQMRNNPLAWTMFTDQVEQYFGAVTVEADATALWEYSPINQVEKAHGAFLLTASEGDPVVGAEQTRRYETALRKSGRPVTAHYFQGEGHGYTKWQTKLTRARAVELFLARKIGGKAKKIDLRTCIASYWK